MKTTETDLWADSPSRRLRAVESFKGEAELAQQNLIKTMPDERWPFGMPTSINPWCVVMGISPGVEKSKTDSSTADAQPYGGPAISEIHDGFGGEHSSWDKTSSNEFWKKVRALCVKIIQSQDQNLTTEECLKLSGLLNLSERNEGRGGYGITDSRLRGCMDSILRLLKPKVIVLLGWGVLRREFEVHGEWKPPHILSKFIYEYDQPDKKRSYKPSKLNYTFRLWHSQTDWGTIPVIAWPNHPSRPPFKGMNAGYLRWEKSIEEAVEMLRATTFKS